MTGTQAALYAEIDLELSWSEAELPERERTKHVHRLHPYLGKYVPQLVEAFLRRYAGEGDLVWDPFCGSGTTLVEANAFGARAAGCDVSAFNCLLSRVKTGRYDPAALLADVLSLSQPWTGAPGETESSYLRRWYAPRALAELLAFRERIADLTYQDLWRVVLSRAARSARLTRHDTTTSTSPSSRRPGSTRATSTGGPAGRSGRRRSSCAATSATPCSASRNSQTCARPGPCRCCTVTRARSTHLIRSTWSSPRLPTRV
jgi:hypothetical protein